LGEDGVRKTKVMNATAKKGNETEMIDKYNQAATESVPQQRKAREETLLSSIRTLSCQERHARRYDWVEAIEVALDASSGDPSRSVTDAARRRLGSDFKLYNVILLRADRTN
jgi:hypothetical protein